jgi:hypothetical protein
MMLVVLALGAVMVLAGVKLILRARAGARFAVEVLRRPTRRIAEIAPGIVEVSGEIAAEGSPIEALTGARCVAVKTTLSGWDGDGKGKKQLGESTHLRAAPATLRDGSGECDLDLSDAEIAGVEWIALLVPIAEVQRAAPAWLLSRIPEGSTHVTIEENVVPDGARVLVTAETQETQMVGDGGGYRAAKARFRLGSSPERRLVLAASGQTALLLRTGGPVLLAFITGALLCAHGAMSAIAALTH